MIIKATPKEIATLVLELQRQQSEISTRIQFNIPKQNLDDLKSEIANQMLNFSKRNPA